MSELSESFRGGQALVRVGEYQPVAVGFGPASIVVIDSNPVGRYAETGQVRLDLLMPGLHIPGDEVGPAPPHRRVPCGADDARLQLGRQHRSGAVKPQIPSPAGG